MAVFYLHDSSHARRNPKESQSAVPHIGELPALRESQHRCRYGKKRQILGVGAAPHCRKSGFDAPLRRIHEQGFRFRLSQAASSTEFAQNCHRLLKRRLNPVWFLPVPINEKKHVHERRFVSSDEVKAASQNALQKLANNGFQK
ncbi:hypothetical protein TNCV_710331 [Trichonephila clavipes]|uniref:Uncharacterized protein n=1 Tax=Trichonephila clavipes TaxID=2585209 RepID=A0A8X6RCL9_TRICX|nr:hypothetical protein TNCV_710331 [Trichonephila clavipes]